MANTKKELTNILNALTGETHAEHEFNSKAEIIGEISKNTSGGGGGGDAEPFYVTFTVNPEGFVISGVDKTYAEVAEADEAGKRIVGVFKATVAGQEIEMLKTDIAASFYLENGKTYIWQYMGANDLTSILYDIEGYQVITEETNKEAVFYTSYHINNIATSDLSCDDTAKTLFEKYQERHVVRARVDLPNINDVFFDLAYAGTTGADTYEVDFIGTYLDGTSLVWLKIHHESTGGNEAFALTKKTIETV